MVEGHFSQFVVFQQTEHGGKFKTVLNDVNYAIDLDRQGFKVAPQINGCITVNNLVNDHVGLNVKRNVRLQPHFIEKLRVNLY